MKEVKLVFVQAGSSDVKKLAILLGGIRQNEYHFIIMPSEGIVLTKKVALEMLARIR